MRAHSGPRARAHSGSRAKAHSGSRGESTLGAKAHWGESTRWPSVPALTGLTTVKCFFALDMCRITLWWMVRKRLARPLSPGMVCHLQHVGRVLLGCRGKTKLTREYGIIHLRSALTPSTEVSAATGIIPCVCVCRVLLWSPEDPYAPFLLSLSQSICGMCS